MRKFNFKEKIFQWLKNNKNLSDFAQRPEFIIFLIFCFLFLVLIIRLFFVQIVHHKKYEEILNNQHVTQSSLKADR